MHKAWGCFQVEVAGYGAEIYAAPSASKAKYEAYLCDAFNHLKFGQFLRIARARRCTPPQDDGYSYIRRAYGVSPAIGQRCRLRNEGKDWEGKEGFVIYPGRSTAHVHIIMDGMKNKIFVHPLNVELLPPTGTVSE
jgi:hypothetical protein